MKKHNIPKCWSCKEPLTFVNENIYERYEFDIKTGTYKTNIMANDVEMLCCNCGVDIKDIFPEGVCNF